MQNSSPTHAKRGGDIKRWNHLLNFLTKDKQQNERESKRSTLFMLMHLNRECAIPLVLERTACHNYTRASVRRLI